MKEIIQILNRTLTEKECSLIIREVLIALLFLHSQEKRNHERIQSSSILIDSKGRVKLDESGFRTKIVSLQQQYSSCGLWMSPEAVRGEPCCDIWSLGITVIEMMNGAPPFAEFSFFEAVKKVERFFLFPFFFEKT